MARLSNSRPMPLPFDQAKENTPLKLARSVGVAVQRYMQFAITSHAILFS